MQTFTLTPTGTFSLREAAEFSFGGRAGDRFDGVMRMAFCLDGYRSQVGVELRQDDRDVHGRVHDGAAGSDVDVDVVRRQVARILSLDHDALGFPDVGIRDPVIGRLQRAAPGLLPVLFYSPYEAAVWAVLSARRAARQMARVREQLSAAHGRTFQLGGRAVSAVPLPERMLELGAFPGISREQMSRLHGVARKACTGVLDVARLRHIGADGTDADMRHMRGIGPFYSSLITIRAVGFADVPPADEPILRELVTKLYHLPETCSRVQFLEIAERWRPYRTWASVLIRAASHRLDGTARHPMTLSDRVRR